MGTGGGGGESDGLGIGAILGIVFGALIGAAIIGFIIYKVASPNNGGEDDPGEDGQSPEAQQSTDRDVEEDITASPPHHDLESEPESDQDELGQDGEPKGADDEESNVEADEVELDSEN